MGGRSLINLAVNNPHGYIILKSIVASNVVKDVDMLFKLVDDVVEEVGEELDVQVVIENASTYKVFGKN